MKIILLIGAAGFLGSLLRYAAMRTVDHALPGFPWGALFVNVTGAFLAGVLFILSRHKIPQYEAYFPVLFIGFFGAYTTFSSFAMDSARLLFNGEYVKFTLNVLLQNLTGILAACSGIAIAKAVLRIV